MNDNGQPSPELPVFSLPLEIVRPSFPPLEGILTEFSRSLASGQVTNNGPWVQAFERQLQDYLGITTLVFSSGQAALMTMIRAAGVAGGEVIVPSLTFAATPHAAAWCGARPVFADVKDDMSFAIDPEDVERRITDRTVAILSVDPYGIASDYEILDTIGRRHGLKVLHDSAASFGTTVNGRLVGGFGDAQIFSFHATKAFNTMEGGCLCSHDVNLMDRARIIRNFGQADGGDCPLPGMNGKMMEVCAIIGMAQLQLFEAAAANRRKCVNRISMAISNIDGLRVGCAPAGQDPIWLYLPVVVESAALGCDRDELTALLARENLKVRKYYSPPCHTMSAYTRDRQQPSLATSERLARSVIALPIYNDMTPEECDGIVEALRRAHAKVRPRP